MKKIILILSLICTGSFAIAQTVINFDDDTKWTAGSASIGGYALDHSYVDGDFSAFGGEALRNGTAVQDGIPGALGTYSWRMRNNATVEWTINIATGGVNTFSLDIRRWDGTPSPDFNLEYSTDLGTSWNLVDIINNASLDNVSDWKTFNGVINNNNNDIKIRIISNNATNERIMVDNFSWFAFGSGGTTDTIASVTSVDASVLENIGTVTVNFSLNQAPVLDKTVDFELVSGNAAILNNYTTQTVTFLGGSTSASVVLDVTQGIVTGSEVLTLQLSNPSSDLVLGTNIDYELTVNEMPTGITPCSELFFSEYIEGSSNNKTLEIYNPTAQIVDLSNYEVRRYNNGGTTPSQTITLSGFLVPGDVYVIANSNADAGILNLADLASGFASFNGDDAVELFNVSGNAAVDIIGEIGVDPGASWTVGTGATAEFTLIRMATVDAGTTTWLGLGDTQWDVLPQDDSSNLGVHSNTSCTASIPLTSYPLASSLTACLGDTIWFSHNSFGGTKPYTSGWEIDGVQTVGNELMYITTSAGTISVTHAIVDATLASDDSVFTIEVFDVPTSSFTADNVLCSDAITINNNSTGNTITYAYNFSSNLTQNTFDANTGAATYSGSAGGYSITQIVTDINSCIDSSNVVGTITLPEDATFILDNSICDYDSIGLTANNTLGTWSGTGVTDNGDGTGMFEATGIAAGNIDITYSIVGVCGSSETNQIEVLQSPDANFTFSSTGSTVNFTNTTTNDIFATAMNWNFGDGTPTSNEFTNPSHTYSASGTYTVCLEIVNGNGCSDSICQSVTIQGIGIESNANSTFSFYPNPSNGLVTVVTDKNIQLEVINIIGEVLYNNSISGTRTIDFSNFSKGTYFVRTILNGVTHTEKLILK